MNQRATKPAVASGPVAVPRPAFPTSSVQGGKKGSFLEAQDVREKAAAATMEDHRKSGRILRDAVEQFARDYEFHDRGSFVDGLSGRAERLWPAPAQKGGNVGRLPDSMPLNRFLVSVFMMYESINHQEHTMDAVDFCIAKSEGNSAMAASNLLLLARIAMESFDRASSEFLRRQPHDARGDVQQGAGAGGLIENARAASYEPARKALLKTIEVAKGCRGDVRPMLHVMSAVSSLACRVEPCGERMELFGMGRLPLPDRDPYLSFLRAIEKNLMPLSAASPALMGEFLELAMEMHRQRRDDLLFSAVAVINWAALLKPAENRRMVGDTFAALRGSDREFLIALERGFLMQPGMLAMARHSQME
jgi:hypothetical protein